MSNNKFLLLPILLCLTFGMAFAADNVTFTNVVLSNQTPLSGATVTYSVNWTDIGTYTLSNWTFSTNNTGAWVNATANSTFVNIAGGNETRGTFIVNTTSTAEGINNYYWRVYAINTGGEWNNTGVQQFNISEVTPVVTIRSPEASQAFTGTIIGFYATAYDNIDGTLACKYNVDGGTNTSFVPSANNTEFGYNVDGGTRGDSHTLYVYCNDDAYTVNSGLDTVAFSIASSTGGSSSSVESTGATSTGTGGTAFAIGDIGGFGTGIKLAFSNFWNWLTNLF